MEVLKDKDYTKGRIRLPGFGLLSIEGALLGLALLSSSVLTGCVSTPPATPPNTPGIAAAVVGRPGRVPEGVVRYCWEEPIVDFESNGPGVDVEGKWYHPYYLAVREHRMGRWRPCRAEGPTVSSEYGAPASGSSGTAGSNGRSY